MSSRKYQPGVVDNVEDLEQYKVGGFHPIHIGDTLDSGRYRVVHKLGFGGFATVWLGRDQDLNRYVALKILVADFSKDCSELKMLLHLKENSANHAGRKYVASLIDHFWIEGPNGSHICLVSPVAGPSISAFSQHQPQARLEAPVAQKLALQVTQGLAFLHSIGVGHGDLTPSNTLLQLINLDSWSEEEVYDRLGQPYKDNVATTSGDDPEPSAPTYLVEAMSDIKAQYVTETIFIIDFGQSFFLEHPPADGVGTPLSYRAPEAIFDLKAGACSDVWALACTIFEIRAGQALFEAFFSTREEIVRQIVQTFGKLPEPWWEAWECRLDYFEEDGRPKKTGDSDSTQASMYPLVDLIKDIGFEDTSNTDQNGREEAQKTAQVSPEEIASLEDLLSKMLKYTPKERISAEDASRHPWFTTTF